MRDRKQWASLVAGVAASVMLVGAGDAQLLVSEKEIERQARVQWLQMKRQLPQAPTPRLQAYVECVAYNIIDVLEPEFQDAFSWEVIVFDDDSVNAFALPGGKVGVLTGVLRVADNQDALAAVIGHEIAHLTKDHVIARAKRQRWAAIPEIIAGAATGIREVRDATSALAEIGFTLPYARDQESEADAVGLEYMARAGFDPRASIDLWKNMGGERQSPSEFVSTHPADDVRLENIARVLTPALIEYNQVVQSGRRPNCSL